MLVKVPRIIGLFCCLLMAASAGCDGDDENPDSTGGGAGSPSGGDATSPGDGTCTDSAGMSCGDECSFDPGEIDCTAACENIAEKCAAAECDSACTGLNQDVQACVAACDATKGLSCVNESFGCWATETTCDGVGACFQAATQGSGDGDADGTGGGESGGGAGLQATGEIKGNAFTMKCDPAYYEQPGLGSLLQCQDGGLHMIQCRTEESDMHDVMGQVMVHVKLFSDNVSEGENDYEGDGFAGVILGGTLEVNSLSGGSTNVTKNLVTVTSFEAGVGASGTFEAEWTGGDSSLDGNVSGSFDFECP